MGDTIQLEIIDFGEVMVFGGHPVDRHKAVSWILFLQLFCQVDDGDEFVNEIERACE